MTKASDNEDFVRLVQQQLGVTADGWAGAATMAALTARLAGATVSAPAHGEPLDANDAILIKELERDEGRVAHAYQDSLGYWTIGIGRLIDKRKGGRLSNEEIDYLKHNDIKRFKGELDSVAPWWRGVSPARQRAILNMTFNLGSGWITPGHVKAWPTTTRLMREGKWVEAAAAIRSNGVWMGQVGDRAKRIADQIERG